MAIDWHILTLLRIGVIYLFVRKAALSSYRMFEFILGNSKCSDSISTLKLLYFSLIKSKLEYTDVVCCIESFDSMKAIQRKFLKCLMWYLPS